MTADAQTTVSSSGAALVLLTVSAVGSILLGVAAVSAESNSAIFWFGLAAVLCASLSIVLIGAAAAARRSSRTRMTARRITGWTAALTAVMSLGIVGAAQGADSWCSDQGWRRAEQGFGQSLSLSAWPPGVRCALTYDEGEADVYWPVNW